MEGIIMANTTRGTMATTIMKARMENVANPVQAPGAGMPPRTYHKVKQE